MDPTLHCNVRALDATGRVSSDPIHIPIEPFPADVVAAHKRAKRLARRVKRAAQRAVKAKFEATDEGLEKSC